MVKRWLIIAEACFAGIAAILWLLSAAVSLGAPDIDQRLIGLDTNPAAAFNAAMQLSTRLSAGGALAACLAAVLAVVQLVGEAKRT